MPRSQRPREASAPFGFANPILVGEQGDVVAGHGRLAAARQLGFSDLPVILLQGLTELQRRGRRGTAEPMGTMKQWAGVLVVPQPYATAPPC
jgi:ParB-like nuclease family protein